MVSTIIIIVTLVIAVFGSYIVYDLCKNNPNSIGKP